MNELVSQFTDMSMDVFMLFPVRSCMFGFPNFTAPPQHVHSQIPVFSPNLFLINFSHKAQQNRGRAMLGLLGVDAGSNNVRELLAIAIP